MMPSENCVECGKKLTDDEKLWLLEVCHMCECTMWLGEGWQEELNEHGGAAD